MLMWLVLSVSIAIYIKLEAVGLYRRQQFKEILLGGFLWLVVLIYAFAFQVGAYSLLSPAGIFKLFAPLVKVII